MRYFTLPLCLFLTACGGKPAPQPVAVDEKAPAKAAAEAPVPSLRTVDLSEFGIRVILDLPGDVAVEPQVDGGVLLSRPKGFAVRIDRQSAGAELAEPTPLDIDHAASFFGSEVEPSMRLQYDKFEKDGITQIEGRLQPGKAAYAVHIRGPYPSTDVDAMVAVLATARIDDAIRRTEQKQEAAAVLLAGANVPIQRIKGEAILELDKPLPAKLLAAVLDLPDLGGIAFDKFDFKDADLEPYAALMQIRSVSIESPLVTDKAFETIQHWKYLRELRITGAPVSGFGFDKLRGAKNLRELRIGYCPLRSSSLQSLVDLPLEKLNLSSTDLTDAACEYLAKIGTLQDLYLMDNRMEGKAIEGLAKLPDLRTLAFVHCPLEPVAFRTIAACPKLKRLVLAGLPLADRDLSWTASMRELSDFYSWATDLGPKALGTLGVGPKLKTVSLLGLVIPEEAAAAFRTGHPTVSLISEVLQPEPDVLPVSPPKGIADLPAPDARARIEKLGGAFKIAEEAEGRPVVGVFLKNGAATDLDIAELRDLTTLESLDFTGCAAVGDAGLAYLAGLKNLGSLKLKGTKVAGDGLVFLKDLKKLTVIELPEENFTTKQLTPLMGLPSLERINCLGGQNFLFKLRQLAQLKEIRELDSHGNIMELGDLTRQLGHFPKLETLRLRGGPVDGKGFAAIGALAELRTLELRNVGYTRSEEWKALSGLKELRELTIQGDMVDDSKLAVLRELSNLERLTLECPRVTDKGIGRIRDFGKLHELSLAGCSVGDVTLTGIGELKEMEELDLTGTRVTDAGLAKLKDLEELRHLKLGGAVTGKGFESLRGLTRLRTLQLRGATFADGSAEAIRGLNSLIEVSLPGCMLKASDVEAILGLPDLRKLTLPQMDGGNSAKVAELAKKYANVKVIHQ